MNRPATKRGGRGPRIKGNRLERDSVKLFQSYGIGAERIPLSGAAGGKFAGDISVPILGADRIVEVKARATGFVQIYQWLDAGPADLLIIKNDRRPPLAVLPLKFLIEVVAAAEKGRV
jgi:hypothetical protein